MREATLLPAEPTLRLPTRYLPIPLTHSMSRIDGFAIAQHTRIDANLRSGRSFDRLLIRATSARCRVIFPPVSARLSMASSSAIPGRSLLSRHPICAWSVLVRIGSLPCFHLSFPQHQLEALHYLSDMPLICLNCDAVAIRFNDTVEYSPALLEVWVSPEYLFPGLILFWISS